MSDKKQEAISNGNKAKWLLENDLLNSWWDTAAKNLFTQFVECPISNKERLLEIKALMDAHQSMKADFNRYIAYGNMAKSK